MKYLFFTLFFLVSTQLIATHNRAGEITYTQVDDYTFEVTITTYTYIHAIADRPELGVSWGDNTTDTLPRLQELYLPNDYKKNVYISQHTYPGPGTYEIMVEDPNRNEGIDNILGSVNVMFAIKTTLQINSLVGSNSTPVLLNPPYDKGAVGHTFIHNPAAYDPDGDSISYALTVCLGDQGKPIEEYSFPPYSNKLYVDSITGDLVWDAPTQPGQYNVAMKIEEWRNGVKIGSIIRDLQIDIEDTDNEPPEIEPIDNICVTAGDTVVFEVVAKDTIVETVTLTSTSGLYILDNNPATFGLPPDMMVSDTGTVRDTFRWVTNCSHVRKQPYQVIFKAEDNNYDLPLVDFENVNITVVAPPIENIITEANSSSITLNWDKPQCTNAIGYKIYRKQFASNFSPDECQTGVPTYTGYKLIATIDNFNDTTFIDNDPEDRLVHGFRYCYIVTSYFEDGAESYASQEVCEDLILGIPIITMVSVETTDSLNGKINLEWEAPKELDTTKAVPPYRYLIFHAANLIGGYSEVDSIVGTNLSQMTTFTDSLLNTLDEQHIYNITLFYKDPNTQKWADVGTPEKASAVWLSTRADNRKIHLEFQHNVPWTNEEYTIYRKMPHSDTFDSLTTTTNLTYTNYNLENGEEYCYYVKTTGKYNIDSIKNPIINYSQIACDSPQDTIAPCPPKLNVESDCENTLTNLLTWNLVSTDTCLADGIRYNIYYTQSMEGKFGKPVATNNNFYDTTYTHNPLSGDYPLKIIAGCYAVTATDSSGNESEYSNKVCVDNCPYYDLPNVFSPDGDGTNDTYKALLKVPEFIDRVDMKIYNRWGNLVYETTDKEINWKGEYLNTNSYVSAGIYYYICDVYEHRLTGIEPRNMLGFIYIYKQNNTTQP